MRPSVLLGALCAAGAVADLVTEWTTTTVIDWTTVTITTTITAQPPATKLPEPDTEVKVKAPVTKTTVQPPAPKPPKPTTTSQAEPVETVVTTTIAPEPTSTVAPEPTSEATTTTAAPAAAGANTYQTNILYSHNVHRANHSATDLTWSGDLEASAQVLAASCVYQHDTSINGGGYGQNIGYGVTAEEVQVMISNLMYNNEVGYFASLYGQADPDMTEFEKWGHFSQIVWKGTTQVGCATVVCDSLGNVDSSVALPFTVCNYGPPGNYDGEYATNVLRPLGQAPYSA